jgi:vitamin B12 transporter
MRDFAERGHAARIAFPVVVLALVAALAGPRALAQPAAQSVDSSAPDEVVVTASRTAIAPSRVGSALTVIDRETLRIRQHKLVADALRDVPGIAVSRGGGLGAVTQVRVRGSEGNHVLVLIDGVEANNPVSNSEFDFANLLAADVERIEILRGAQSALYGSDAVGGVINIITRQAGAGLEAALHADGGSFGAREVGFSAAGGRGEHTGGLSVTRFSSDGENIARFGNERDGFENEALTLHGRAPAGDRLVLSGNLRYIDARQDFDTQDFAFPPTPTQGLVIDDDVAGHLRQWFLRLEASSSGQRGAHRFGFSETDTENTFFDGASTSGRNRGAKTKLDYQYTLALGADARLEASRAHSASARSRRPAPGAEAAAQRLAQALTFAVERELVDYENRGADAAAPENQAQEDRQTSIVVEYRAGLERADFSASARLDHNELFDDASTYRLTGSLAVGAATRLHTSLGTGVANPGFFELFGFFPGSFAGNPSLEPEQSSSFDIGLERRFGDGRWLVDLTYFRADLEDEIQTTFDAATFLSTVRNLPGDSTRRGAELSVNAALSRAWRLAASYTYTDAEQPDGLAELRRARHIASLDNTLHLAGGRARLHVGIDYNGAQEDNEFIFATPEERVTLGGYTVVDVAGDFDLTPRWRLYARVENLLDEEYEEWFAYRGRSRAVVAGFELKLAQ